MSAGPALTTLSDGGVAVLGEGRLLNKVTFEVEVGVGANGYAAAVVF